MNEEMRDSEGFFGLVGKFQKCNIVLLTTGQEAFERPSDLYDEIHIHTDTCVGVNVVFSNVPTSCSNKLLFFARGHLRNQVYQLSHVC